MNISFVVLHYKTQEDTIECVNSIIELICNTKHSISIVIVDNASNNGSIEFIKSIFSNYDFIHIIENSENLGFARGNNVGYDYAKMHLHSDFIVVTNNDIVVVTKSLADDIVNEFNLYNYHILGPDIISIADGQHQNPMKCTERSPRIIKKRIRKYQFLRLLNTLRVYDLFRKFVRFKTNNTSNEDYKYLKTNTQLHGAFLIFSPAYVSIEDYAFCQETFLYCEESILYLMCQHKKYSTLYDPSIIVNHKEDSSTNYVHKTGVDKRDFLFKNLILSYKVYLRLLKQYDLSTLE